MRGVIPESIVVLFALLPIVATCFIACGSGRDGVALANCPDAAVTVDSLDDGGRR